MRACALLLTLSAAAWAHGQDPEPLPWHELLSNLGVMLITLFGAVALGRFALWPVLKPELQGERRNEVLGWCALGLAVVLGTSWWATRQTVTEAFTPPPPKDPLHSHHIDHGGQVAMWGDYHAELVRQPSGTYQFWLSDAYRRAIGAGHYDAFIRPRNTLSPVELEASLDGTFRQATLDRGVKRVDVEVRLSGFKDPIKLLYAFDGSQKRGLMGGFCGPLAPKR